MLISDFRIIGNKLLQIRKSQGLTQSEVAEKSGISDRTYADIERGNVNMRLETLIKICKALKTTPNDILTEQDEFNIEIEELFEELKALPKNTQKVALKLLSVILNSAGDI